MQAERSGRLEWLIAWLRQRPVLDRSPLLAQPAPLASYLLMVVAGYLALIGWELARTPLRAGDRKSVV